MPRPHPFITEFAAERRRRGLRQEDVAAATGLTQGFVSLLERGVYQPSLDTAERLATAFGKRLALLDEDSENTTPAKGSK